MHLERILPPVCLCLAVLTAPVHGSEVRLGMTRAEFGQVLVANGSRLISDVSNVVAVRGSVPEVEFERYKFVRSPLDSQMVLWQASTVYRFPASPAMFDSVAASLEAQHGVPTSSRGEFDRLGKPFGLHERVWQDAVTTAQLATRWEAEPQLATDRMMLSRTELRLALLARASLARRDRKRR
ncbi:MAG: hypothetical protein HOP12_14440 [Candidatus Eisenbacteria bacterium]|uniref:Uncharacterized protein n=1 Tax=Eiseniibacteriota bacterium TaxID=2212470 RepID=A0A849T224_UNCEI|nr:hypothetical protein [Candidatus Eisenbacteria bacterium]